MTRRSLCLALALATGGCERPRGAAAPPKEDMSKPQLILEVAVDGDGTDALTVRCTVRNHGDGAVQVLDSPRLPYLLDDGGALVVLHGVHPPPDDRDYNVIEIPTTRALAAGESLTFSRALVPLVLHGHYEDEATPPRHGAVSVVCRLGYGATAITAADRRSTSIERLLAWQQLVSSAPVTVHFP